MLQNGARFVYAIDVGTNQLAWKLRQDERVRSMEKTNIRYVTPEDIGEAVDFVSIDVAFFSDQGADSGKRTDERRGPDGLSDQTTV